MAILIFLLYTLIIPCPMVGWHILVCSWWMGTSSVLFSLVELAFFVSEMEFML